MQYDDENGDRDIAPLINSAGSRVPGKVLVHKCVCVCVCTYARCKGLKRVSAQVVVKHRSELMKTNFAQIALTVEWWAVERSGLQSIHQLLSPAHRPSSVLLTPTPVTLSSSSSGSTNIIQCFCRVTRNRLNWCDKQDAPLYTGTYASPRLCYNRLYVVFVQTSIRNLFIFILYYTHTLILFIARTRVTNTPHTRVQALFNTPSIIITYEQILWQLIIAHVVHLREFIPRDLSRPV